MAKVQYCFCSVCLFVCLFGPNFNIGYNFWTQTIRDFIFGMHIDLVMLYKIMQIY